MRRALLALAVLAFVLPPAGASEAADCTVAPVPTRAPEASHAVTGLLAATHATVLAPGSERADARLNITGAPIVTLGSVHAVLVARPDVGAFSIVAHFQYDLVGTRSVTCFTWTAPSGYSWRSIEVWGNATTGDAAALDVWLG